MTAAPLVSIAVPCRNEERFLDEALRSLAGQTLADLEVVVADDASEDGSAAIADAWRARDPRFRVIRSETPLGMTENWNRALAACAGRYVAKLDGDDAWEPRMLATLVAALEGGRRPLAAFARAVECDEALRPVAPWHGEEAFRRAGLDVAADRVEPGSFFWRLSFGEFQLWQSSAFLVSRLDFVRLGGFDERWSCASDTAFLLRLLGDDRPVSHSGEVGVLYRRRAGSVSATFAERGWKALEGHLVRLDALARDGLRFSPLARDLRQAWWQNWRDLRGAAARRELWEPMTPELRRKLARAMAEVPPPPPAIRLEGWLRLQAWRLRHLSRSGGRGARP